ncbi:MAG: aminotransferase class III-fold pyridoxal phosphate-dependent enzyme [Hyphomicrobiaceae bacterium]
MTVFERPKPELSPGTIAALLRDHYGLSGDVTPLVSERDQNARLRTAKGDFVLKIANAAEDRSVLELQNAVLRHIAKVDPTLGVPRLIAARSGVDTVEHVEGSARHAIRLLTYLPGRLYSEVEQTPALGASLGSFMGRLSRALAGFGHPAAHRPEFLWSLDEATAVKPWLADIADPENRALVERIFARYEARSLPNLERLRAAVVHQDANDNNILIADDGTTVTGLIDFGDMCFGRQVNELAVTLAYALLDKDDLYAHARPLISAYAREMPISGSEAESLFDLVAARLAVSVSVSSHRAKKFPENDYLLVSQRPAFALLERLDKTNPAFLAAIAREAAGLDPVPSHDAVVGWLNGSMPDRAPLLDFDLDAAPRMLLRLEDGAPGMEHAADRQAFGAWLDRRMAEAGARYAIGLWGENRTVYKGDQFRSSASPEWRSQHLGLDLFVPAGTPVLAPLAGTVLSVSDNDLPYDYGPTVMLEHECGAGGLRFWTLYGHLARETLTRVRPGQAVAAGERIGSIGTADENGGWLPHLHFQVITDRLGQEGEFPGVGQPSLWPVWSKISPDPNLILKLAPESFHEDATPPAALLERRRKVLGPSLSISYQKKLKIVRGKGAYLYDHTGRGYLDCVNNICHVGHAHPHVVEALAKQAEILNTNTRYLHDNIVDYAERLAAKFPKPLSVVYMVCSGSEANELALRMARTVTGRRDTIVVDWGYHGNTQGLIDVSPYKFNRKGGKGKPDHVEIAALPDPYRGTHKGMSTETGLAYAQSVEACIDTIRQRAGQGPAAFIAETISGCGGQVVYPDGYLSAAFAAVRRAGGLCIVDEVQTGFGRVGSHFWAHETQGVVPDIVTLGKPIGNGHPMAAVVTTPEIAQAFANGMEFFSSFGGNPVSAAVGNAVLDVIEREGLQAKALAAGTDLLSRLRELQHRHPLIGDVRGKGLFVGVEMVRDRTTLEPATNEANQVINDLKNNGILVSTDGPFDNVLKIKPPICFGLREAELLARGIDAALLGLSAPKATSK